MGDLNVTLRGFLDGAYENSSKVALIDSDQSQWTFAEVSAALASIPPNGLSGHIGVLMENRLLAGLVSCAVMRHAICVPLDPKMTASEIRDRLDLLGIKTVVVDTNRWVDLGIPSLVTVTSTNHQLTWSGEFIPGDSGTHALVLMTSGSTGVPKIVRLSHENLIHSTDSIIESIALTDSDRAINLLPMAHIGGLVDLFLVPLISGGSLAFADPRDQAKVSTLLASSQITWLQGPPAILQSLLRIVNRPTPKLRLIRSVSAPLPHDLFTELSAAFDVPLVEMYGMSETAGVITSNPLPPARQKIGSVGKPVNCEILIKNTNEVWVRSKGLFHGYANEADNEGLWEDDAFFTGDLGHLDPEGYLFLTGRAKDLINRGGQKITPCEIDQIAESWPEVREAASFGFPHPTLGEEVGLALVLKDEANLTDQKIRERLSAKLTDYKLPKRLIRIDKLPRNQSGKLQRFLLAEISPTIAGAAHSAETPTEKKLTPLWCSALGIHDSTSEADFFDLGGDSLSATSFLIAVEKEFKVSLHGFIFYENATISGVASAIEERLGDTHKSLARDPDFPTRVRKKLLHFLASWPGVPPFEGSYARVDERADPSLPFFFWCCNGVKERDLMATNARDYLKLVALRTLRSVQHKKLRNYGRIAKVYADEIERIQPTGPLILGGYCEGGRLIVKAARLLIANGREIRLLVLHDYLLEEPFPSHVAMIHSTKWKSYPPKLHDNIALGWRKIYRNRCGVLPKEGKHSGAFSEEFQAKLQAFIPDQLDLSISRHGEDFPRQDPRFTVNLISKLPRFLNVGQKYPATFKVTNTGSNTISPKDGVVLHARWLDINGHEKPGAPMFARLPSDLAPGESDKVELNLIAHKKHRLYQIQVAIIEEGWGWTSTSLQKSHRQWKLIR